MPALFEEYRPDDWGDVVGQGKVLSKINVLRNRGLGGRAYWINGQTGTGKTTIARLLASEVADDIAIEELDTSDVTTSTVERIRRSMSFRGIGKKGGMVWIINEAHGLTAKMVQKLLTLVEPEGGLPDRVMFIFTTTVEGQLAFEGLDDGGPLLSRCIRLELSRRDLARPFAERARKIAEEQGLNGRSIEAYVRLVQKHRNNLRAVLQDIESGAMLD